MLDPDDGVPVETLIGQLKDTIAVAGLSKRNNARDLQVSSVQLILKVVATQAEGVGLSFRVPFIGTELHVIAKHRRQDTHTLDITLRPPDQTASGALRSSDLDIQPVLAQAIRTIRRTVVSAATGDDPWVLSKSTVDISFGVTREGSISVGAEGELANEMAQILRLSLMPAAAVAAGAGPVTATSAR